MYVSYHEPCITHELFTIVSSSSNSSSKIGVTDRSTVLKLSLNYLQTTYLRKKSLERIKLADGYGSQCGLILRVVCHSGGIISSGSRLSIDPFSSLPVGLYGCLTGDSHPYSTGWMSF